MRVVLYAPRYAGRVFGPPLSLLHLAGAVREAGFPVQIVDGVLGEELGDLSDCLCLGISVLTGPGILDAIRVARQAKAQRADLPVIFGGWHPSLSTEPTLREDYVDVVVRHQGERTLVEIVQRLAARQTLDFVEGCWFKRAGRIVKNPDRHTVPLGQLPKPAYDLANLDAYEALSGERTLPYAASVGCPYACNYCTDQVFYSRRVNAHLAERVAEEMTQLAETYRVRHFALVDSNFLVDVKWAVEIARALQGARFHWSFQASTDLLCRMSDEEVRALYAAGVRHIGFGTESASERVLERMNKAQQSVAQLYEAARKCDQAGIHVTYNLIFGYPGERREDRAESWRVLGEIVARHPNVSFSPNVFTPYPGIPIWEELEKLGVRKPGSLGEWADVDLGKTELPWLEGGSNRRLEREIGCYLLAQREKTPGWLRAVLQWRIERGWFGWPVELWAAEARRWVVGRRSLLTGRALAEG